jgi:adenylate cyclase
MAETRVLRDRTLGDRTIAPGGTGNVARRLAAILAADVAGYSRLMRADEERTHERLKAHRRQLVDPKIKEHHGRIVKTTGDGMLVEFISVVDAVRCAVEMQRAMVDRNADIAEEKRITFRVGVNLGDVIAEAGDIYGDGVNVAARLEALAEPGGICISGMVWDHIRDKLPYKFKDMGEQSVKNIERPVRVYAMDAEAVGSLPLVWAAAQITSRQSRTKPALLAAASIAAIAIAIGGGWLAWPQGTTVPASANVQSAPTGTVSNVNLKTTTAPRLSIVVLPLANLSNDPDQEYFVDAITDDLTTDLTRISDSFVIARNTAFTYKGKAVDAKQISRELGVRYVLEGSARRMGDQVQVNIQLIDGETGAHTWADRFETDRRNLAEAQSAITSRLARTLHLALMEDAGRRIEEERAVDPDVRDLVMRGWASWHKPDGSAANRQEALRAFERALEIDPRSIDARIGIGLVLAANIRSGFTSPSSVQQDKERAEQLLLEALVRDANRSMAHAAMGLLRRAEDRMAETQAEFETAIALDRNNAWAISQLGNTLLLSGQPEAAIPYLEKALRISPRETFAYVALGKCHLFLGDVDEAMNLFRKAQATHPGSWIVQMKLAGTLGLIGKIDEARAAAAEMVRLNSNMNSVARIRAFILYRNPRFQTFHDKTIIQGLRNIGFPEELAAQ